MTSAAREIGEAVPVDTGETKPEFRTDQIITLAGVRRLLRAIADAWRFAQVCGRLAHSSDEGTANMPADGSIADPSAAEDVRDAPRRYRA